MGYVLSHHSSLFLQFRAINGVPNASREFSFDHSSQPLHQVTSWRSRVISRDLAINWLFARRRRCGGAPPSAPADPEARSVGLYSKSTLSHTVYPLEVLQTDVGVGVGGELALWPHGPNFIGQKTLSRASRGGIGAHRSQRSAH